MVVCTTNNKQLFCFALLCFVSVLCVLPEAGNRPAWNDVSFGAQNPTMINAQNLKHIMQL